MLKIVEHYPAEGMSFKSLGDQGEVSASLSRFLIFPSVSSGYDEDKAVTLLADIEDFEEKLHFIRCSLSDSRSIFGEYFNKQDLEFLDDAIQKLDSFFLYFELCFFFFFLIFNSHLFLVKRFQKMSRLSLFDSDPLSAQQYISLMKTSFSTIESNVEIIQGVLVRMYRITSKVSNEFIFDKIQLMYINTMDIVSELEELKHRLSSLSYADY
ncbi:hypothetical protein [Xylella fastidiosa]|uniref:Uncharacterized protein n=2 Tax=Xylella fastidiosa TaxID=2371 RepID=A0AAJ5UIW1_XYLFS|nr:hypothetical protein [Xylella fastidiosa]WCF29243.1 hypothetical protein OK117_05115 [Xylella fastidiosa subsp. fastidiosa]